jgi:predicted AlkP superfamily phosphohydrolase/phosphomutase
VYIDQWLAEKGWLAYDRRRAGGRELVRQAGRLLKRRLPNGLVRQARQSFPRLRTLDWSRTQAYAGLPSEYGIFLNVRGREPAGSVEPAGYEALRTDIIAALRDWRDPRTGRPVMAAVYRREELYRGPFVTNAPDIVFELLPGYKVSHMPYRGELLDDVSGQPDGFHEREGIFAMSGPGIQAGAQVARARIEDVLPTLLYALDLPVPDDLDGRVLLDIFGRPVRFQPVAQAEGQAETRAYSEEEEALLVERLKGLGYLDDGS